MSSTDTRTDRPVCRGAVRPGWLPYVLSGALAVAATAAAALSSFVPSVLTGAAVGNGNLRGTAMIVLLIGLPTLVTSMIGTSRGSTRWLVGWLGTLGYLLYQAVLFCFATPLNGLFLCYVAYLGLAVWSIVTLVPAVDLQAFGSRVSAGMPARFIAGFAFGLAALNAAAWLSAIIPALLQSRPEFLMKGTGLLTNPVYVQDLAIWLPLLATAAVACWRRMPWGLLATGAMLAMFTLEGIGVASDQWFGSRADPSSPAASMTMVPAFAVLAVVTGTVLALFLHGIADAQDDDDRPVSRPVAGRYGVDAPLVPGLLGVLGLGLVAAGIVVVAGGGPYPAWTVVLVLWDLTIGLVMVASSAVYLHTTLHGKFEIWSEVLAGLTLRGDERVLDMGCGRGAVLMLVARRLDTGRAVGLDLWRGTDQTGNSAVATRANAHAEGVADRVDLRTGDMASMPFGDAEFDLVVASMALHNVPGPERRAAAVDEAVRVLRPGGRLAIVDFRHVHEYERRLAVAGLTHLHRHRLGWRFWYGGPWAGATLLTGTKP